jgi:hypothetical protein
MTKKEIYETSDYSIFNYLNYNREINQTRALKIGIKIEEHGFLVPALCGNINGKLYVIDGQHRIRGAELRKLPVSYIAIDITADQLPDFVSSTNEDLKAWTSRNFFDMWICLKKEGYVEMEKLMMNYCFNYGELTKIIAGQKENSGVSRTTQFKNPNYKLSEYYKERLNMFYNQMNDVFSIDDKSAKLCNNQCFRSALIIIMNYSKYDHLHFINNLSKEEVSVKKLDTRRYLRWMVDVFNYGLPRQKRIEI